MCYTSLSRRGKGLSETERECIMAARNFDHIFCDSFVNVNNGMVVSKESMERAHDYLMARMEGLHRKMKGLHYGKPRRNALDDEYMVWDAIDMEIVEVLLFGHDDEWKPVK